MSYRDGGEPAYVIDLFTALPLVDGKPNFSQPFRILPQGVIHRYGKRTVTTADIEQFADNWRHRRTRGIRRERIVIDAEHETGGIGWYREIFSQGGDGLWAKIALSANGRKLLDQRDFYFFSPTVAWESKDRVTGEEIRNQIVGGALTNYPVFGDDTALPTLGYSEAALHRLWQARQYDEDTRLDLAAREYAAAHHMGYTEALYAILRADDQADVDLEDLDEDGRLNAAAEKYAAQHNVDYLTALKAVANRTRLDAMGLDSARAAA